MIFFDHIYEGLLLFFFYDIIVYSRSWVDHLYHLTQVLQILFEHQLYIMSSKCQFKVMTVGYLGYLISFDSVAIDLTKIQSVQTWPVSTSPKGVRGFLGLAGYYRKFVRGFGVIVAPLTKLLTNKGFHWTEESLLAFNQLKYALTSPPVLRLLDFTQ
jgi:hypothetical protein